MNGPSRADLDGLTRTVFGTPAVEGAATGPHDLVVVWWQGRPRMLVPRSGRRAAAGVVRGRPRLTRPREARKRRVLAAAFWTGAPQLVLGRRGPVVPGNAAGGPADFVAMLRERWDPKVTAVGFSVRALTANHKPTFVAVDRQGQVRGFGKIAGDVGARDRLSDETAALRAIAARPVPGLRVPTVLAELTWRGEPVLVVEPVPTVATRHPNDGPAPLQLVRAARPGLADLDAVVRSEELAGSIAAASSPAGSAPLTDAAYALVDALRVNLGGICCAAGRSHGDLVPWNVATAGNDLWAWDWEHSLARDAAATDVVHWHVQLERHVRGRSLLEAHRLAEPRARLELAGAGLGDDEIRAVRWLARLLVVARWATLGRTSAKVGRTNPEAGLQNEMVALLTWD